MKKHIILYCMITVAVLGFAAGDSVEIYELHYNAVYNSNTVSPHAEQLRILQEMAKEQPSGATEFYARALRKLVSEYTDIKRNNEKKAADEKAIILAAQLGAAKYAPAASDLWLVAKEPKGFEEPLARAEAMMALGNIPATAFIPQIVRILESLNVKPTPNRLAGERVATGAIVALERYKDPSGYLPVFFASIGWYSEIVREQAIKSLSIIAEDPSPFMLEVVKKPSYKPYDKYSALQSIEASKADSKKKAEIAVEALTQGWLLASTKDVQVRKTLVDMRMLAINMINRYRSDDQEIYRLLVKSSTDKNSSLDEKFSAIATLASQGTPDAAKRLSNILDGLNTQRKSNNINQEDEQLVRAVIPALSQLGFSEGKSSLAEVNSSGWPPAVIKLADDALKQIISSGR
jgi:hypothetical protein